LAALRTASDFWLSALYTFAVGLLLIALVAARFRRGNGKAFWFGFAVFGWGFFLLGYGPWRTAPADPGEQINIPLNRNLITSRVILALVPYVIKDSDDVEDIDKLTANAVSIAHVLVTLAIGIGGGLVSVLMRRRRGRVASIKSTAVLAAIALVSGIVVSSEFLWRSAPFFPEMVFGRDKDDSDFTARWYREQLTAMGEPSLWMRSRQNREATIYRLLWLPTFDHSVCVRIERMREGAKLRARVLNGMGGYAPGQVAIDRSVTLVADQLRVLERQLEQAAFWDMPASVDEGLGSDGDQLIIEAVTAGKYHVVDRWNADLAYVELCRQMLDLTGLKLQKAWAKYHVIDVSFEMLDSSINNEPLSDARVARVFRPSRSRCVYATRTVTCRSRSGGHTGPVRRSWRIPPRDRVRHQGCQPEAESEWKEGHREWSRRRLRYRVGAGHAIRMRNNRQPGGVNSSADVGLRATGPARQGGSSAGLTIDVSVCTRQNHHPPCSWVRAVLRPLPEFDPYAGGPRSRRR
jgi:hypothetical protein